MYLWQNSDTIFIKGPALQALPGPCLQIHWQEQPGKNAESRLVWGFISELYNCHFNAICPVTVWSPVLTAGVPSLPGVGVRGGRHPLRPDLSWTCTLGDLEKRRSRKANIEHRTYLHPALSLKRRNRTRSCQDINHTCKWGDLSVYLEDKTPNTFRHTVHCTVP